MLEHILRKFKTDDVSRGAKVLTAATAIRWIGWGFAENLIPVFIFSFSANYAQAGLLKSSYDLTLILIMPILGILADRFRASTLILIGYAIYIITGFSYLFAGITGLALFIILARVSNAFGYGLDGVGRDAYYRRSNPPSKLATVFGYFDSISNFWWIAASLVGIFLLKYFSIPWLLFMIVPTVMISFWVVWKWRKKGEEVKTVPVKRKLNYREVLKEFGTWNYELRMIMVLNFFLMMSWAVIGFFLPIQMFTEGAGYTVIILFGVFTTVPFLFGLLWGKFFDKKGPRVFIYGLLSYSVLLFLLSVYKSYFLVITFATLISIIQEFVSVGKEELITVYADPEHFGRVDGLMRSVMNMGTMIGPLLAGVIIDATGGEKTVFLGLSACMMILTLGFALEGRRLHMRKLKAAASIPVFPESRAGGE